MRKLVICSCLIGIVALNFSFVNGAHAGRGGHGGGGGGRSGGSMGARSSGNRTSGMARSTSSFKSSRPMSSSVRRPISGGSSNSFKPNIGSSNKFNSQVRPRSFSRADFNKVPTTGNNLQKFKAQGITKTGAINKLKTSNITRGEALNRFNTSDITKGGLNKVANPGALKETLSKVTGSRHTPELLSKAHPFVAGKHAHGWTGIHRPRLPHPTVCFPRHHWCHPRPAWCHWWYDYCTPIRYCLPAHCVTYTYSYVTCGVRLPSGVVVDTRWYLGLNGMLLPGKGFGIERVDSGSPAERAGLTPGMVITHCNGIDLVDENSFPAAVEQSGGVLRMTVLDKVDGQPASISVAMERLATSSF